MVNSRSDLLGNLVKKDSKEITIENTIGPNDDLIRITYRRGITAGDILVDLDMANDNVLADVERELSLGDIIPPSAELMLIPGSIAGGTQVKSLTKLSINTKSEIINEAKNYFFSNEVNPKFNGLSIDQINNEILGLDKNNKDANKRIQRFNDLTVEQWHKNCHKEILKNIEALFKNNKRLEPHLKTISIASFINKDGIIKHVISVNGETDSRYSKHREISIKIRELYKSKDIIVALTPSAKTNFIVPKDITAGEYNRRRDNHAEIKIFEELVNQEIAKNSKIFLSPNRRICVTCRMVKEQFEIFNDVKGNDISVKFYDVLGNEERSGLKFTTPARQFTKFFDERKFREFYQEWFVKQRIPNYETYLDILWNLYGHRDYVKPASLKLLFS